MLDKAAETNFRYKMIEITLLKNRDKMLVMNGALSSERVGGQISQLMSEGVSSNHGEGRIEGS